MTQTEYMHVKAIAVLLVVLASMGVSADTKRTYAIVEIGQIASKFTDVFAGPTIRTATGYKLTRNLGLELAYEFSPGGTAADNFWSFDDTGTRFFDNINMLSGFGTVEWNFHRRFSYFTKVGLARGKADYHLPDGYLGPTFGTLLETNLVLILGVAVPTNQNFDITLSIKENTSANFFGLGDSFDATTVSIGLRRSW